MFVLIILHTPQKEKKKKYPWDVGKTRKKAAKKITDYMKKKRKKEDEERNKKIVKPGKKSRKPNWFDDRG